MKRYSWKNRGDGGTRGQSSELFRHACFKMVHAQRIHSQTKLQTADALKLLRVKLDCKTMRLRDFEHALGFISMPRLSLNKNIQGTRKFSLRNFRDEFCLYLLDV